MAADVDKNDFSSEKPEEEEDLMDLTGGEGPWQRWIFVVAVLCSFSAASHNMAMSFFAPNLDHWCSRPPGINVSVKEWKAIAIPPDNTHCSRYKFLNYTSVQEDQFKNGTLFKEVIGCDSWEYDDSIYKSTVLSQFNLVCGRQWLISLSKSVFIAGYFLSATVFGYLADKFGRKPIIVMCNAIALASAITSLFSTSFLMFAVTRFFIAAGITGFDNIKHVLLMEVISPKYRSAYGIGVNFGWIFGYLCLPGIAWLFRHWIYMQIAITLPILILLSCLWLLPESPRWLLAHGKTEEAVKIISRAAKRNGFAVSEAKLNEVISKTNRAHEDPWWITEIVSLFGKFFITSSFSIIYVFSTEIFPTMVRTVGLGSAEVCALSGAIIAPFVREMGKASHPLVPQFIFGFLAVTAGFLSLLLPETKNRSIPDTIREAAHISRGGKRLELNERKILCFGDSVGLLTHSAANPKYLVNLFASLAPGLGLLKFLFPQDHIHTSNWWVGLSILYVIPQLEEEGFEFVCWLSAFHLYSNPFLSPLKRSPQSPQQYKSLSYLSFEIGERSNHRRGKGMFSDKNFCRLLVQLSFRR
ncbi:Solute carrier family 22 member 7 [Araneus ventricosus]|uniref:Solute carrier family 22 member 7 n=1 Tax=Araneus ventricosus TaxID=182803 RepID=A0A4Y2L1Y4_ARAVE|nr:Solute carrier family 22 member 7 [Araneus ventricosus]